VAFQRAFQVCLPVVLPSFRANLDTVKDQRKPKLTGIMGKTDSKSVSLFDEKAKKRRIALGLCILLACGNPISFFDTSF
jgi:hypothetical protein